MYWFELIFVICVLSVGDEIVLKFMGINFKCCNWARTVLFSFQLDLIQQLLAVVKIVLLY